MRNLGKKSPVLTQIVDVIMVRKEMQF